jgi:16S rRNA (guanine1207-N2)-methyltransferase
LPDHYFSEKPSARSDRRIVETRLRGKTFAFVTDAGVFSKQGVDFGSRLLIETMAIEPDDEVLDAGCGYGPIGLTAAWLAERGRAVLVDVNERAVELAKENARLNRITNVEVLQSDLFEKLAGKRFTKILTNPPIRAGKQVVHRLFEEAFDHLRPGGELWVVIQNKQGAPSALDKLESVYGDVEEMERDKGYRVFRAQKSPDK